ncbi:serine/threonine protein kinase [Anaeromyxobacter dehalogenans 2CP-1]|uniref:Serine/threonine protein kinase n=1 Tax=Anaeromyxobacter dehalogenans (strain ATCC BAA-258 / DSM 21875 / 2CP-1) TaxID=455488 RepID=B8JFN3_ANAD2|nr:serine/threonine protein kinase [Anaeromyxobacter dehalogenans 2CP-1]
MLRSRSGGATVTTTSGSGASLSGAPRPGETLELGAEATRYQIVRSLGMGGTAEVFLARRLGPAGFARPVALKCILTGLDVDESTRRAFVYEAQLASKLRHPNIAEAYDLALVGDRYYLVLEYVDGVTVRGALRAARRAERHLSEAFCCHVAASVAEALHHAHTLTDEDGNPLGIVHRDVTAVNVMISRSGAVKLLDFGVALARMEGRERTRTGQFRGTFVYASPEQALSEELDGRSDLFSLGVVLVEMLTGLRVFDAGTDIGTMRKIAECSPEDVEAAIAALPRELAGICAKALARRPPDRFQDGAAFSRALREYLTARGITYSPSDCAQELGSLGLLAAAPDASDPVAVAEDVSNSAANSAEGMTAAPDPATAQPRRRAWRRRAVASVAVVAGAVAILATGSVKLLSRKDLRTAAPAVAASAPAMVQPAGASETEPTPRASAAGRDVRTEPEPIVRPKASASGGRVAATVRAKPLSAPVRREHSPFRTSSADFADRATVGSPRATLPRGTLVAVKLLRVLAGPNPGRAEAIVTEEVAADGVVLVPKGSTVSCSARPPADGRVPLSCDSISTSDRVLTFSGVAVGEGQHVGLRLLDDEIAAGTPFVVYVSAPAALR